MTKKIILSLLSILILTSCSKKVERDFYQESLNERKKETQKIEKKLSKEKEKEKEMVKEIVKDDSILPNILAKVDNDIIYKKEIEKELKEVEEQYNKNNDIPLSEEQKKEFIKRKLEQIIDLKLITFYVKDNNIKVSSNEIDSEIDKLKSKYSEENFKKMLEINHTTEKELKDRIYQNIITKKVMNREVYSKIEIKEEELKSHYNAFYKDGKVKARHILFKIKNKDAKKRAEALLQKIKKDPSLDFAKLAKEYSEGPSSVQGGDLGWFTKNKMVPAFEKAVFALKIGEISGIVETNFGFHIIKLEDKVVKPFEVIKDQILDELRVSNKKLIMEKFNEFKQKLYSKYKVEKFIKY